MTRCAIAIHGTVQGVGFRPFVFGLATRLGLGGFVRNQTGSVTIEVEGEHDRIDDFIAELRANPPPLARIETIAFTRQSPRGQTRFEIHPSKSDATDEFSAIEICPDIATCGDCLAEIFDPRDRRFGYAFTNCTNCGPRLTIVRAAPYDRARTTMAAFQMCDDCRREYENPRDRRFHAQPIACAKCGPRLRLLDATGRAIETEDSIDPIMATASALRAGKIVAIKGIGGFHLACDAMNESAVRELRRRKHREEKPFAVMMRDIEIAAKYCEIDPAEREFLESPARPIVLLDRREDCELPESIAPKNPRVGVMLPYTPVHHLLLARVGPLVMTSGNRSDEPIAFEDADALSRLSGIADLFLLHDRPINVRCDDSVVRRWPIRRSRGFSPQSIALPQPAPAPILAVGGQLKSTFALARDDRAIVSHHLGDLDHFEALRAFERDVALYRQLFAVEPRAIAHDLHPDYASTRFAMQQKDVRLIGVQHHHAHVASCMVEHGLDERVIGVSFDGTGFGTDGAIWGGEFLACDFAGFERVAHLRYVRMPGADKAIREPWRMALAHLVDAGVSVDSLRDRIDPIAWKGCGKMIEKGLNAPLTSSAGRLFDALASMLGVRDVVTYEAQAAMELEWLALRATGDNVIYPFDFDMPSIDTRPMIRAIARDVTHGIAGEVIARRFHRTMAAIICQTCEKIRQTSQLPYVVLSGGGFMNELMTDDVEHRLTARDFKVFRHRIVPTNDGGLSLGQLAVAIAQLWERIMCLGIPGKVIRVFEEHDVLMGKVDFAGVTKSVCLQHVPEVVPGQYVLVHVGFALSKIDEDEAKQVFAFLDKMNQLDELSSDQLNVDVPK